MKADLYIGDDVHSVEFVSPPRWGDGVIFGGRELEILRIAHDCDKRKLAVTCFDANAEHAEATKASEDNAAVPVTDILEDTIDLEPTE